MTSPRGHILGAGTQPALRLAVAAEPLLARAEDEVAALCLGHGGDHLERRLRQRHVVRTLVLGALARDRPDGTLQVQLGPAHAGDLVTPLPGQEQKLGDPTRIRIAGRLPDGEQ
ncbi:hypothetical protein QU39_00290, partial [Staphylococcus aureus]